MLSKEERNSKINKIAGVGLSARPQHYSELLRTESIPWLEVLADNYLYPGSPKYEKMEGLASIYPLVFHCVGFNLGSIDALNKDYMKRMKELVREFKPAWVSDHLCFCGSENHYTPDLLPIPYTKELLGHITDKIERITNYLEIPFLVENVSLYMKPKNSDYTEEEFLYELSERTCCGILLDVNNLYVNSQNYDFDPYEAFLKLPRERIEQIHLAGHTHYGTHIVDTHSEKIQEPVLFLFEKIIKKLGPIPVTIERDDNIPSFREMCKEVDRVKKIYSNVLNQPKMNSKSFILSRINRSLEWIRS